MHTPNATCLPDEYACYAVKEQSKLPRGIEVTVADQFTTEEGVKIKKAKEICVPVDKDGGGILNPDIHLVCYDVKSHEKVDEIIEVTNQFTTEGPQKLKVKKKKIRRVCVPSLKTVINN